MGIFAKEFFTLFKCEKKYKLGNHLTAGTTAFKIYDLVCRWGYYLFLNTQMGFECFDL